MNPRLALMVLCALSIPAFAGNHLYGSGNDFLSECSALDKEESSLTNVEMFKNVQCVAYIRGLMDGATYEDARIEVESKIKLRLPPFSSCLPPEGVRTTQLGRVVLKYIRENPEKAHFETSALIFAAFNNAFPCSRK